VTNADLFDHVRLAERFLMESAVLGLLALCFLLLILWTGGTTLLALWRHRKDARGPLLYFVGWGRLGLVMLLAVALPLLLYWATTRLTPFASVNYGFNARSAQILCELGATMSVILTAALLLGRWAVRARCREADLTDPVQLRLTRRRSLIPLLAACLLAVGIASHLYVAWGERRHVAELQRPGQRLHMDELDYTLGAELRSRLRELPHGGAVPLPPVP
jgi:hypothetical protein